MRAENNLSTLRGKTFRDVRVFRSESITGRRQGDRRAGFTLLEVLVAIAVLSMIVVAVANLFGHSTTAMDTGQRRVQSLMVGRSLVDYFMREATMALPSPEPSGASFYLLRGDESLAEAELAMGQLFENTATLSVAAPELVFGSGHGRVRIAVAVQDKGQTDTRRYTGMAFMWNRNRYAFD